MGYLIQKKQGFTLVELSIVLVIIGLLIGGILSAQSMISAAKTTRFIGQISQYDVAIPNFQTLYNSLPGDTAVFTNPGDGDGWIEPTGNNCPTGITCGILTISSEIANVWPHLSMVGLKAPTTTNFFSNDFSSGVKFTTDAANAPKGEFGKNTAIFVAKVFYSNPSGTDGNGIVAADCSAMTSAAVSCRGAFTGAEALAVDTKIDNGKSSSGFVLGGTPASPPINVLDIKVYTSGMMSGESASPTLAYNTTSSTPTIILGVFVGGTTGNK